MICDAEFWAEIRRTPSGDALFAAFLPLIHERVQQIAPPGVDISPGLIYTSTPNANSSEKVLPARHYTDPFATPLREPFPGGSATPAKALTESSPGTVKSTLNTDEAEVGGSGTRDCRAENAYRGPSSVFSGGPPRECVISSLQQVLLFSVPVYALRYNIPAMSMSWTTSCYVDKHAKQLVTFGAGNGVKVPQHLRSRGCVAGDTYFAIVTDKDEVWASGNMRVASSSSAAPTTLAKEEVMTGIAGKTLMLVGHGQRLASVTRAFTMRPLSATSNPTRSVIPSRHIRFLDFGYGDDCYMVGTDSVVYKTTASERSIGTPRRVMTLSRTPVSRIASGTSFMLIIDQNGHLYTIGRNRKGQLGNGLKQDTMRKPFLHTALMHHFIVMVAAGDCHSLALTSSGVVYGAGSNESGQLGLGNSTADSLTFTRIPLPARCIGIAAGPAGSMFACDDGRVFACGLNDCAQLGVGSSSKHVFTPMPVTLLTSGVESYTMDFGAYRKPEVPETPTQDVSVAKPPPFTKRISSVYTAPPEPTKETKKLEKKRDATGGTKNYSVGGSRGAMSQRENSSISLQFAGDLRSAGNRSQIDSHSGMSKSAEKVKATKGVAEAAGAHDSQSGQVASSVWPNESAGTPAIGSPMARNGKQPRAKESASCGKCCTVM